MNHPEIWETLIATNPMQPKGNLYHTTNNKKIPRRNEIEEEEIIQAGTPTNRKQHKKGNRKTLIWSHYKDNNEIWTKIMGEFGFG